MPFDDLNKAPVGESSATIRERVIRARAVQAQRFKDFSGIHCNAQMTARMLRHYANMETDAAQRLHDAMDRYDLSARAYDRILKVARTIADLDDSPIIRLPHISEAIGYRNLDRSTWGE